MKRIVALVLALAMLLATASAGAEEIASTLKLSALSLSHESGGKARTVRFGDISLFFALGSPNGSPTLQATFDNGEGQVVDAVAQLSGTEILLSMGGISGVYAIDLNRLSEGQIDAELLGQSLGGVLTLLAMTSPEALLRTVTSEAGNGTRVVEVNLSTQPLIDAMEGLLSVSDGMEATSELDMDALRAQAESVDEEASLSFSYREKDGTFALTIAQGSESMRLSGVLEMRSESMIFVEAGSEEEKYDLLDLDTSTLEQLQSELNLIGIKFMHFADGSGLDDII